MDALNREFEELSDKFGTHMRRYARVVRDFGDATSRLLEIAQRAGLKESEARGIVAIYKRMYELSDETHEVLGILQEDHRGFVGILEKAQQENSRIMKLLEED